MQHQSQSNYIGFVRNVEEIDGADENEAQSLQTKTHHVFKLRRNVVLGKENA